VQPPHFERSASSPLLPAITSFKSPCSPPDITARDLTRDELKRNYSQNNVWNIDEQPLPPMPQMRGFGRYRRSVDAPVEWQMEHLDRHFSDVKGLIVNHLGDNPPAGLDQHSWRMYRAHHSRTNSAASSRSSDRDRPNTVAEEYFDIKTGTRVSRGFCASTTSSANSSFKEGSSHYRRDSNLSSLSMTSPNSDIDQKYTCRTSRSAQFGRRVSQQGSSVSMIGLAAIQETQETGLQPIRKLEKPCVFDDVGNTESAVASDDDEDNELDWTDMLEVGGATQTSNLAKQLERTSISKTGSNTRPSLIRQRTTSDEKNGSRGLKRRIFERGRPGRAAVRVPAQHHQLQRKQTESTTKLAKERAQEAECEKTHARSAEHLTSGENSKAINLSAKLSGMDPLPIPKKISSTSGDSGSDRMASAVSSPEQIASHILSSTRSDTSHETLFISRQCKEEAQPSFRGRYRSGTASTIRPGHC